MDAGVLYSKMLEPKITWDYGFKIFRKIKRHYQGFTTTDSYSKKYHLGDFVEQQHPEYGVYYCDRPRAIKALWNYCVEEGGHDYVLLRVRAEDVFAENVETLKFNRLVDWGVGPIYISRSAKRVYLLEEIGVDDLGRYGGEG